MTEKEQIRAAKEFAEDWKGKGYEKGQSQPFWLSLLRDVYGKEQPEQFIEFEKQVHTDSENAQKDKSNKQKKGPTQFIDGYIPSTKVLIEQKQANIDLNSHTKQSDGSFLTPYQQAKKYIEWLPQEEHPKWIVTCNFKSFYIYDMNHPNSEPEKLLLDDLPKEYYRLQFLVDKNDKHVRKEQDLSFEAGEIVGKIYDALYAQYKDKESVKALHSLNVLCVRLVFCLYAENSGLLGKWGAFHDYLSSYKTNEIRKALIDLFNVLDTPEDKRDQYLESDNPLLASFPYVNGGLFSDDSIEIPPFTEEIRDLLIGKASEKFNWSGISPTIFGAIFESTLNPETRRSGGMHYTSVENIHKVIDPLFLDDLTQEFDDICLIKKKLDRKRRLVEFKTKLASMTFLDPACGSGNFLTETYLSLRRLENKAIICELEDESAAGNNIIFETARSDIIQVALNQFYGIEINDFAVTVAKTALWIAESQMFNETQTIVHGNYDFLPLKSNTNIVEANALKMDWWEVVPKDKLSYIMGNPPFVGGMMMTRDQKAELKESVGKDTHGAGEMDYVAGWFYRAADYIQGTNISCAFVASNSIVQGQQATDVWEPLICDKGVKINFAYRTFIWDSEADLPAHVHCVIIGFSTNEFAMKRLFDENGESHSVAHIDSHLQPKPDWFIHSRSDPICNGIPKMRFGSMPRDGGGLILSEEEKEDLIKKEPESEQWIREYCDAQDFLHDGKRFCLWLVNANVEEWTQCHTILNRISQVKEARLSSSAEATRRLANTPELFAQNAQPDVDYLLIPGTSSETRSYVPMAFMSKDVIASNANFLIPNATLYHFGVLTSSVHMAWMRAVCGRLEMRYRYSKDIVYNTFPWPNPTADQKKKIELTAQAILNARVKYPHTSLGDMYGKNMYLYKDLVVAHEANDKAVMEAYGWKPSDAPYREEEARVEELKKMYQKLCSAE